MNLSAIAIKRPVFTVMVTVAVLVLGSMGFTRLGTDLFPDVSFPVVVVTVPYPGASPSEVENLVTQARSRTRSSASTASIACARSRARACRRPGSSSSWASTSTDAATEVRERVAQIALQAARGRQGADGRRASTSRRAPIATYTLRGGGSLSETRKFADDVIKPALEQVRRRGRGRRPGRRRARDPGRARPRQARRAGAGAGRWWRSACAPRT